MKLYSTNNHKLSVDLKTAIFNSLPADGGLYMPADLPHFPSEMTSSWENKSLPEIAFDIAFSLLKDDIAEQDLRLIIADAINFSAPFVPLENDLYILELFHGPSLAFKDFGARFMSRIMAYYLKKDHKEIHILVATSGDTGGAVALGFLNVPGIKVSILYPKGKVSAIQELQLTSNGYNIEAIEIDGTFDDCQAIVKKTFKDEELNHKINLTSANSINICRLIPQMFYYAYAYSRLKNKSEEIVFVTPSGNFGNMAAGLMLQKMGLPVKNFIAATNENDIIPEYLETGIYTPRPSVQTLANAMDVGDPSNFVRILDLFNNDLSALKETLESFTFTDDDIRRAIIQVSQSNNYSICPHTATGLLAAKKHQERSKNKKTYIVLSTAHPCKFPDVFQDLNINLQEPDSVKEMKNKALSKLQMQNNFDEFKAHLLNI